MRYRKIPVEIEAVQLSWDNWDEICRFVPKPWFVRGCYLDKQGQEVSEETDTMGLIIKTLESNEFIATENDFIIKGVNGEFYACKPDIFAKTYIAVLAPSKTIRQIAAEENDSEHGPAVEHLAIPVVTKIEYSCPEIAPQDGEPCALAIGHSGEHSHVGPFRNYRTPRAVPVTDWKSTPDRQEGA